MCSDAGPRQDLARRAVRQHRVGHEGGEVGAGPQHHQPELLVRQVPLGGSDGDADLDVRLNDRDRIRRRVDVHQPDMREVAGIVVAAGDERGGGVAAAGDQHVPRVNADPVHLGGGCRRRFVAPHEEGERAVRMLQHCLLHGGAGAVEQAIEPLPARQVAGVPVLRLVLDDLAEPAGEGDVRAQPGGAGGHDGAEGEEGALKRLEQRIGWRDIVDGEGVEQRAHRREAEGRFRGRVDTS